MDVAKLISVLCQDDNPCLECTGLIRSAGDCPNSHTHNRRYRFLEVTLISIITTGETTKTGVVSQKLLLILFSGS